MKCIFLFKSKGQEQKWFQESVKLPSVQVSQSGPFGLSIHVVPKERCEGWPFLLYITAKEMFKANLLNIVRRAINMKIMWLN